MLCGDIRVCYSNCWQFAPQLCVRLNISLLLFIANVSQTQALRLARPAARCHLASCLRIWSWQLFFWLSWWGLAKDCAPFLYPLYLFLLSCLFTVSAAGNAVNKTHVKSQTPRLKCRLQEKVTHPVLSERVAWNIAEIAGKTLKKCVKTLCYPIVRVLMDLWSWLVLVFFFSWCGHPSVG